MDINELLADEMTRSSLEIEAARPTDIDPESDSWLDEVLLSQTGGLGSPAGLVQQHAYRVVEPDSYGQRPQQMS